MSRSDTKIRLPALKKALVRAFESHGHKYNCSAARGMERDCTCGWLEILEMVKQITQGKKGDEHG